MRYLLACSASFFATILLAAPAYSQISVYVSPNDIQSAEGSGITGVTTENFNSVAIGSFTSYSSPIGTYTSAGGTQIQANNQYGGDAEGNYLGITTGSNASIDLTVPSQYFGFYFTAGDRNNSIEIYSAGSPLLTFSTATLINLLPRNTVSEITAINGTKYKTGDYYGQPVSGSNATEPYAYLHFITRGAVTFDRIVLRQSVSATFENDNHSIVAVRPAIPGTLVLVSTPEPGRLLLMGGGILGMLLRRRRQARIVVL